MARKVLGRGLDALISQDVAPVRSRRDEQFQMVAVNQIRPNPHQPRTQFDRAGLEDLAKSIQEKGILEPLIVRQIAEGEFELIAGERRLRAAQIAGLDQVPVLLRTFTGSQVLEVALIENLQREDLNPVEEARAYQRLAEEFGRTHAEISGEVGKDRSTVTNLVRLLRLPEEILEMVSRGTLSVGHARVLLAVDDAAEQRSLACTMVQEGWSVREAERRLSAKTSGQPRVKAGTAKEPARNPEVVRVEEALRYTLGTDVRLFHSSRGGRVEIRYGSDEELERILELMGVQVH